MNLATYVSIGFFCALCTPATLAASTNQFDKEKVKEAAKIIVLECQEDTGATLEDILAIKNKKLPESHAGLCMVECVFNRAKITNNKGKFVREGMVNAFKPLLMGDATKLNKLKELSVTCDKEVGKGDKDKCKTAKMLVMCIARHARAYGFDVPSPADIS